MSVIAFTTIMKWEEVPLSEVQNQQEYMLRIWGNRSLTWETTTEFNVGVDLGIFNNRFKLTAEYFKRKITDLLVTNKPLPFIMK